MVAILFLKDASTAGDLYRAWMDIKQAISGKERKAILSSCEYGEDVALKNYKKVTENSDLAFSQEMMNEIMSQQGEILMAHNKVKEMRDKEKAAEQN